MIPARRVTQRVASGHRAGTILAGAEVPQRVTLRGTAPARSSLARKPRARQAHGEDPHRAEAPSQLHPRWRGSAARRRTRGGPASDMLRRPRPKAEAPSRPVLAGEAVLRAMARREVPQGAPLRARPRRSESKLTHYPIGSNVRNSLRIRDSCIEKPLKETIHDTRSTIHDASEFPTKTACVDAEEGVRSGCQVNRDTLTRLTRPQGTKGGETMLCGSTRNHRRRRSCA